MPRYSALAVRLSLLYLALGFTFGALLLANKGIPFLPILWTLLPAHIEILIFGWVIQLAFGVAFWILPRFQKAGAVIIIFSSHPSFLLTWESGLWLWVLTSAHSLFSSAALWKSLQASFSSSMPGVGSSLQDSRL